MGLRGATPGLVRHKKMPTMYIYPLVVSPIHLHKVAEIDQE